MSSFGGQFQLIKVMQATRSLLPASTFHAQLRYGVEGVVKRSRSNSPEPVGSPRAKRLKLDVDGLPKTRRRRAKTLDRASDEGGRQVVRLITILQALDSSRLGLTVADLIHRLENTCDQRTIYRDIGCLERAGFTIEKDGTRHKLLDTGKGISATSLRPHEVMTLLLTGDLLSPIADSELAHTHEEFRRRLAAGLTQKERQFLDEQRLLLQGTYAAPAKLGPTRELFKTITHAHDEGQCLLLAYDTPNKSVTHRVVEPHLLWVHGGRPYLVAYCRTSSEFRKFAIQRIQSATVHEDTFERRTDFDPRVFTGLGFGVWHGQRYDFAIRFEATVAHLADERSWHATQRVTANADGSATLEFTASGLPEVAAWVASFGGELQAQAPAELVEAVRSLHRAGLLAHSVERDAPSRRP